MTAKGNMHNLETAFMWTVKSSNHLHSRILDFSSSSLILLVVSEMVWIFSSPWCFSIFSAFFFLSRGTFPCSYYLKSIQKNLFIFGLEAPTCIFFFIFFWGFHRQLAAVECDTDILHTQFARIWVVYFRGGSVCEPAGISSLFQLAAVTFCYLHIVREAAGLRNNRRLECCMMDAQDLAEIQSIQLPGRG